MLSYDGRFSIVKINSTPIQFLGPSRSRPPTEAESVTAVI
jgi:hypothetical protein